MDYKIKANKVFIEGIGDVFLRKMSLGLRIKLANMNLAEGNDSVKNYQMMAESICECWVDESGNRIIKSVDEIYKELDPDVFDAIAPEILKNVSKGDPAKNSESVPTSSLPSSLPEN